MSGKWWVMTWVLMGVAAAHAGPVQKGPWIVESLADDHSFSALGSMVSIGKVIDQPAGNLPNLLVIGCDADPAKKYEITVKTPKEKFHVLPAGAEPEFTVYLYFDDQTPPLEQVWVMYNNGPFIGAALPQAQNADLLAALSKAKKLKLLLSGNLEERIADRPIEFDVSGFDAALSSLVCGKG